MKTVWTFLLALFVFPVILPTTLLAQNDNPPKCCPQGGGSPGVQGEGKGMPTLQGQLLISDEMLQAQGSTRSQFLDRLALTIFPQRSVDLVVVSKQVVPQSSLSGLTTTNSQSLLGVEETLYYRTARLAVSNEDLDKFDQVGLTDGNFYVMISFRSKL
jgi:hypothetical protein